VKNTGDNGELANFTAMRLSWKIPHFHESLDCQKLAGVAGELKLSTPCFGWSARRGEFPEKPENS